MSRSSPISPLAASVAAVLLAACGPSAGERAQPDPNSGPEPAHAPGEVLAEGRFDFRDDHGPGRIVAEIGVRLERAPDGSARLRIDPSAKAPTIHPIPGFRGVRGSNHRTALELQRIVTDGAIEVETRPLGDPEAPGARASEIGAIRTERLAERRARADGTLDHSALSDPRLVGFELEAAAVGMGDWTSTVVVRDRPRLAIDFSFDGERGDILAIRAIDDLSALERTLEQTP